MHLVIYLFTYLCIYLLLFIYFIIITNFFYIIIIIVVVVVVIIMYNIWIYIQASDLIQLTVLGIL